MPDTSSVHITLREKGYCSTVEVDGHDISSQIVSCMVSLASVTGFPIVTLVLAPDKVEIEGDCIVTKTVMHPLP